MFLCSAVWLAVTVTPDDAHSLAALARTRSASKSFERIATLPEVTPQSAASAVPPVSTSAAIETPILNACFIYFSFGRRASLSSPADELTVRQRSGIPLPTFAPR